MLHGRDAFRGDTCRIRANSETGILHASNFRAVGLSESLGLAFSRRGSAIRKSRRRLFVLGRFGHVKAALQTGRLELKPQTSMLGDKGFSHVSTLQPCALRMDPLNFKQCS